MYCGEIIYVEEFGAGGHSHFGQVEEQEALAWRRPSVDLVRLVQIGIVDEALLANCGAGLFEIHAHDDAELCGEFGDFSLSSGLCRGAVLVSWMDRGRQDVAPGEDSVILWRNLKMVFEAALANRELLLDLGGGRTTFVH